MSVGGLPSPGVGRLGVDETRRTQIGKKVGTREDGRINRGWCLRIRLCLRRGVLGRSRRVVGPSLAARQSPEMPEHRDHRLGEVDRLVVQRLAGAEFPYRLAGAT